MLIYRPDGDIDAQSTLLAPPVRDLHGSRIAVLDNGQTWVFIEQDRWPSVGDAVTIRRAALGSFIMIAPSNHTYHVHRTQ